MKNKLLLVDDDLFLRDMYALKFKEAGYEVMTAESASSALLMVEKNQDLAVIVLDMLIPNMSGVELIKEIKRRFPNLTTKIIFLSNQSQSEDISEAKAGGADGYLIKADLIPSEVVSKVIAICK